MGILTPVKPSNRERENAYCCITDGWNWNCRTEVARDTFNKKGTIELMFVLTAEQLADG